MHTPLGCVLLNICLLYTSSARAVAALLATAVQHVLQGNTAPGIQRTGSLWPVELVAGTAEKVNVRGLHINGQVLSLIHI